MATCSDEGHTKDVNAVSRRDSDSEFVFRPHTYRRKVFVVPTWCDVCAGVLIGDGFQCDGPCRLRWHLGLGDGVENCCADMLLTSCQAGRKHKEGTYSFGDVSKQLARNARQAVKDIVVQEAVKEQKELGKFDKLKEAVNELQSWWDTRIVIGCTLAAQVASVLIIAVVTCSSIHIWGKGAVKPAVYRLQCASAIAAVVFTEMLLTALIYFIAWQAVRYSALVHMFVMKVLRVNLEEVDIDLEVAAREVLRVCKPLLVSSGSIWVCSISAWLRALQEMS
eukprot:TRINITY_DN70279_c0_g1_i1.p1 TRINITY_DN70279_c0_g1~~TRINITY_DN70279_c0_g1_i1.p1  ORF type:complete len:279 (+),score=44.92 TRINITY_DN70279_c0_g1_i1:107-943(+)